MVDVGTPVLRLSSVVVYIRGSLAPKKRRLDAADLIYFVSGTTAYFVRSRSIFSGA